MEPNDVALSDVHVGQSHTEICPYTGTAAGGLAGQDPSTAGDGGGRRTASCQLGYQVVLSRFPFLYQGHNLSLMNACQGQRDAKSVDEDGDLVLERPTTYNEVITIEHTLSTRLPDVGLQVWQGCLLLCDFIMHKADLFDGIYALELGGGVGLASIVMAIAAKRVICTDVGDSILELCTKNIERNQQLYKHGRTSDSQAGVVVCRTLDWLEDTIPTGRGAPYEWSAVDLTLLDKVTVLLAADVVYDEKLTVGFFKTIQRLMSKLPAKTLYLAIEKRLNFTLDDLDVACPAYDHFLECVQELCHDRHLAAGGGSDGVRFTARQLDVDFQQRFKYNRTKHLTLWEIAARFHDTNRSKARENAPEARTVQTH